jgi:peptide deformylase
LVVELERPLDEQTVDKRVVWMVRKMVGKSAVGLARPMVELSVEKTVVELDLRKAVQKDAKRAVHWDVELVVQWVVMKAGPSVEKTVY